MLSIGFLGGFTGFAGIIMRRNTGPLFLDVLDEHIKKPPLYFLFALLPLFGSKYRGQTFIGNNLAAERHGFYFAVVFDSSLHFQSSQLTKNIAIVIRGVSKKGNAKIAPHLLLCLDFGPTWPEVPEGNCRVHVELS